MLNKIRKIIKICYILFLLSIPGFVSTGLSSDNSLTWLLPDKQELGQSITPGYQEEAEGEKLIELINGGAVLFFRHGFNQTVFQEYYIGDSTQYINLEIYQMEKPEGAKEIFLARTDTTAKKIPVGQLGFRDDYYCTFHQGMYYVIATGSDSTKIIQNLLLKTVEIIDKKIIEKYE